MAAGGLVRYPGGRAARRRAARRGEPGPASPRGPPPTPRGAGGPGRPAVATPRRPPCRPWREGSPARPGGGGARVAGECAGARKTQAIWVAPPAIWVFPAGSAVRQVVRRRRSAAPSRRRRQLSSPLYVAGPRDLPRRSSPIVYRCGGGAGRQVVRRRRRQLAAPKSALAPILPSDISRRPAQTPKTFFPDRLTVRIHGSHP